LTGNRHDTKYLLCYKKKKKRLSHLSTWTLALGQNQEYFISNVLDDLIVPKKNPSMVSMEYGILLLAVCFLKTDVWVLREISTQPS
jgi:hypothetical protein